MTLTVTLYADTKDICATLSYDEGKNWYDITLQEYKEQLDKRYEILENYYKVLDYAFDYLNEKVSLDKAMENIRGNIQEIYGDT